MNNIYVCGKLVIRENLLIEPARMNLNALGQLEGFTHQASFICLTESINVKRLGALVNDLLMAEQGIEFGVTRAPVNGIIVRILGSKAEQLFDCLKRIGAFCG